MGNVRPFIHEDKENDRFYGAEISDIVFAASHKHLFLSFIFIFYFIF